MKTAMMITMVAAAGCADNIAPQRPDAPAVASDDAGATMPAGKVTTTRGADGTYTSILDATAQADWTVVDFETGTEVATTEAWDLRFQRVHISTNGGANGSGGVEVAPITGSTFDAVTTAPATGYVSDASETDFAFEQGDGWYAYDPATHVLTPRPIVWAVRTNGGTTLKLEIVTYYDGAGTSGWFTLHWAPL